MELFNRKDFCTNFCQHPGCWGNVLQYPEHNLLNSKREEKVLSQHFNEIRKSYGKSGKTSFLVSKKFYQTYKPQTL
jgi:hypothetical protein